MPLGSAWCWFLVSSWTWWSRSLNLPEMAPVLWDVGQGDLSRAPSVPQSQQVCEDLVWVGAWSHWWLLAMVSHPMSSSWSHSSPGWETLTGVHGAGDT